MRLTRDDVQKLCTQGSGDSFEIMNCCGAYYERTRPEQPLVGYAGTDEQGRQMVGEVYVNIAQVEQYPSVMNLFVYRLVAKIVEARKGKPDVFVGAPEGGKSLAVLLANHWWGRYSYPEKKVTALATEHSREKSELEFRRHTIYPGERGASVEDVTNNFSTSDGMLDLIAGLGGIPTMILCLFNRSEEVDDTFTSKSGITVPVISLIRKPFPQYTQDDPYVADEIARGNVVWKPKDEWQRLQAA